jgi:hypothetical protein
LVASDPDTGTLVDEQQVGLDLLGKLNRLPFAAVKARQFMRGRSTADVSHLNPGGKLFGPPANGGWRAFVAQLGEDGTWNPYFGE